MSEPNVPQTPPMRLGGPASTTGAILALALIGGLMLSLTVGLIILKRNLSRDAKPAPCQCDPCGCLRAGKKLTLAP